MNKQIGTDSPRTAGGGPQARLREGSLIEFRTAHTDNMMYVASKYRVASIAYGLFLCLVGLVLTTIEPIKACSKCENKLKIVIESFFIYLYVVAIAWILVTFAMIIAAKRRQKVSIKNHHTGRNRRLSVPYYPSFTLADRCLSPLLRRSRSPSSSNESSKSSNSNNRKRTHSHSPADQHPETISEETETFEQQSPPSTPFSPTSQPPNTSVFQYGGKRELLPPSHPPPPPPRTQSQYDSSNMLSDTGSSTDFDFVFDYENGSGELYMRVGVGIFCFCGMIDKGLSLIQMFETYVNNNSVITDCEVTFIVSIVSDLTSFAFTFMQCFFIFKYANININYGRNWAIIGLMHMVCTNVCVTIRTVIHETVAEIRHHTVHHQTAVGHHSSYYHGSNSAHHHTSHHHQQHHHTGHHHHASKNNIITVLLKDHAVTSAMSHAIAAAAAAKTNEASNHMQAILKGKQLGCVNTLEFTSNLAVGVAATQDQLSPYLFPCIIEYSLMSMTIFYILWENIDRYYQMIDITDDDDADEEKGNGGGGGGPGKIVSIECPHEQQQHQSPQQQQVPMRSKKMSIVSTAAVSLAGSILKKSVVVKNDKFVHNVYEMHTGQQKAHVNNFEVDCGKSTTGLFVGIFCLLLTIISQITIYIYKSYSKELSIEIGDTMELILVSLSLMVCLFAYTKLKHFKFDHKDFVMNYNETLIIIGLFGIYMFGLYSIVAILSGGLDTNIKRLQLVIQVLPLVEGTIQSAFILDGLKMFSTDKRTKKIKPGRSLIVLLMLIDVSLWLSETISVKKYDMNTVQLEYYETVFWSIISSIASPLAIFFRFHCSVCLSDVWTNLYK